MTAFARFRRRLGRAWRGLRLRDAVIFTLPIVVPLLYLLGGSALNYGHMQQFGDWWSQQASVPSLLRARLDAALHAPRAAELKRTFDPAAPDPGILRLEIDPAAWATVQGDPLSGWGVWADATLVAGTGRVSVEVRKRGDTSVHFATEKTSFTLRMPRSSLMAGARELGVSGKTVLTSWVANTLPTEFGVMIPRTAIAPVFVNNRFYGVFRLVEPVDESFLRRAGRMPGNVFRADAAERGEYRKGLERNVFWNAAAWEFSARIDSVPGLPTKSALLGLLEATNGSTFEHHRDALRRVDRAQLTRMLAAALVVGDPYHLSNVHNQYWYEDPTTGLLAPIPWDLRLIPLNAAPGRLNNFLQTAVRDPHLIDAVLRLLAEKLEGDTLYRRAARLTAGVWQQFEPHFRYDLLRRRAILDPGTPDEILTLLASNIRALKERIADTRIRFATGVAGGGTAILDFETAGWAGGELRELRLPRSTGRIRLLADRDLDGRPSAGDDEIPVSIANTGDAVRLTLLEPLPLLAAWHAPDWGLRPGRVHYRLFLVGEQPVDAAGVEPVLRNPYTGEAARVLPWLDETQGVDRGWSAWHYPPREPAVRRTLSGTIRLNASIEIPERGVLEIAPGTTLLLDADVSILSYGRVLARGTATAPIRIVSAVTGVPWGTFALQGAGADSSVFEHVTFREGSSARVGGVGYKGMVSVHHAHGVVFRRVRFERNLRSDDALNAVHATVDVLDCDIVDTNSDGLDYDYSGGEVRGSRFVGTRGDAIDLMTASPLIVGNTIDGSGDKGISVGEASRPRIIDNLIANGNRGIEVKDGSRPFIVHNLITGNRVGLLQNVKNWRYGMGGRATVAFTQITGNQTDVSADDRSLLTLVQSDIGSTPDSAGGAGAAGAGAAGLVGERQPVARSGATTPDWIHASLGLPPGERPPGRLATGTPIRPQPPLLHQEFEEVLGGHLFGWSAGDGVERLAVQDAELVVAVEGREGSVRRVVDWQLPADGRRYQAAVEIGGAGLERVRIRFLDGAVTRAETTVLLPEDPARRQLVTLDLPPGRYTELHLTAVPRRDARHVDPDTGLLEVWTGRLRLGLVQVHGWLAPLEAR